ILLLISFVVMTKEGAMKALTLLTAAALTLLSVASSYAQYTGYPYGKGKAPPPPPVVTKGQRKARASGGTGHCAGPFLSAGGAQKRGFIKTLITTPASTPRGICV